jgi:hypothetical protein
MVMQEAPHRSTRALVDNAGNACATAVSLIRIFHPQHAVGVVVTRTIRQKARSVDSESGVLAIKKFLRKSRQRLIGAPPRPNFWTNRCDRFATASVAAAGNSARDDQGSGLASVLKDVVGDVAASRERRAQMPSFDFRRSLTA